MKSMNEETIYVGRKPPMAYVHALMNAFGRADIVTLKARGRSISTAVDAAEITRRMLPIEVGDVEIGTVVLGDEKKNVSTIEITMTIKR